MTESLDATDWSILVEVQRDGRIPLTELGRRVSLSASATTERVERLEAAGVITGYRADVDLAKVGLAGARRGAAQVPRQPAPAAALGCSRSAPRSWSACAPPATTATC